MTLMRFQSLLESFSGFREAVFSYHCFLVCRSFFSCEFSSGFAGFCCVLVRGVAFHVFPDPVNCSLQLLLLWSSEGVVVPSSFPACCYSEYRVVEPNGILVHVFLRQ